MYELCLAVKILNMAKSSQEIPFPYQKGAFALRYKERKR